MLQLNVVGRSLFKCAVLEAGETKMKRAFLSGVAGLLLFGLHAPAQATSVTLSASISGTLFNVDPALNAFFAVNDPFNVSLTYTYDPALLTVFSSTPPTQTVYAGGSVVGGGTIFGSTTYGFNVFTSGLGQTLAVNNNVVPTFGPCCVDSVVILGGYNSGTGLLGFTTIGGGAQLRLVDQDAVAISNLNVPDMAAYLLFVDAIVFTLRFFDSAGVEHRIFGIGTGTVSQTPLPAALVLFGSGLGLMGLLAARRKRKVAAQVAAA